MLINVTAKGVEVPPKLRQLAEKKLQKLERLLRNIDAVEITLSRERQWRVVELVITADALLVRGEGKAEDVRTAFERLVDRLERRIKKSRSKLLARYREAPETRPAWEEEVEGQAEESLPEVVRSKRFAMKPMVPEEAAAQMELLGHDFYVFRNAETEQVNVLYRRRDGNYGLIEPEL
jgi:putative sigma-54 modulation protein